MDLQDPTRRCRSRPTRRRAASCCSTTRDVIERKIKRAVTDTDTEVRFDRDSEARRVEPAVDPRGQHRRTPEALAGEYTQYGPLKTDTGEAVVELLRPIQERYAELMTDRGELRRAAAQGRRQGHRVAAATLERAYAAIGFLPPLTVTIRPRFRRDRLPPGPRQPCRCRARGRSSRRRAGATQHVGAELLVVVVLGGTARCAARRPWPRTRPNVPSPTVDLADVVQQRPGHLGARRRLGDGAAKRRATSIEWRRSGPTSAPQRQLGRRAATTRAHASSLRPAARVATASRRSAGRGGRLLHRASPSPAGGPPGRPRTAAPG